MHSTTAKLGKVSSHRKTVKPNEYGEPLGLPQALACLSHMPQPCSTAKVSTSQRCFFGPKLKSSRSLAKKERQLAICGKQSMKSWCYEDIIGDRYEALQQQPQKGLKYSEAGHQLADLSLKPSYPAKTAVKIVPATEEKSRPTKLQKSPVINKENSFKAMFTKIVSRKLHPNTQCCEHTI
jgi:hypothetical protein